MAKRKPSELNLLLAVDKPTGCTSHDVVAKVRRQLGERRVGHAGTLDPLATGVMILGVGQATRLLGQITLETKSYLAEISFGAETNTDDAEGEVVRRAPIAPELTDPDYARGVLSGFVGDSLQVPPAFSAISVNGVRAYKRVRAGENVELPARPVTVLDATLISAAGDDLKCVWTVAFTVSKGTYIRALARDIARSVGSCAHISALRRTSSGSISLAQCASLEELDSRSAHALALDPASVLGIRAHRVTDSQAVGVSMGQALVASDFDEVAENEQIALVHGSKICALAHRAGARVLMDQVYPQGIEGVRL